MRKFIVGGALALVLAGVGGGTAFGGEINGQGNPPGGKGLGSAHAASICAFSGLQDGDGAGFPGPGGAPPQNWGHTDHATNPSPGIACNGHTGFLAGGGEEP